MFGGKSVSNMKVEGERSKNKRTRISRGSGTDEVIPDLDVTATSLMTKKGGREDCGSTSVYSSRVYLEFEKDFQIRSGS